MIAHEATHESRVLMRRLEGRQGRRLAPPGDL